jgi:hypothetical protein
MRADDKPGDAKRAIYPAVEALIVIHPPTPLPVQGMMP